MTPTYCTRCDSEDCRCFTSAGIARTGGLPPEARPKLRAVDPVASPPKAAPPSPPEVNGAELLDDVTRSLRRFVHFRSGAQSDAVALWIAHTHAGAAADSTPYLIVTSPEKQSGKTRLQEASEPLVARPLRLSNISTAALFREIEATTPTVFFDEADAIFSRKSDTAEELRGVLNAGHRRGATVVRCVGEGKGLRTQKFAVFCPKLIAAIGSVPDTVADRGVHIRLQRAKAGETVERFRYRQAAQEAEPLRIALEAWAAAHLDALRDARPRLPDALSDRAQDGWEPLLAIADLVGGDWPTRARAAAVGLANEAAEGDESLGALLLRHISEAFGDSEQLTTIALLEKLIEREDGPWAAWWARDIEDGKTKGPAARLARLLKPFGIKSKKLWIGAQDGSLQGFRADAFEDAFARYLPPLKNSEGRKVGAESSSSGFSDANSEGRKDAGQGGLLAESEDGIQTAGSAPSDLPTLPSSERVPTCSEGMETNDNGRAHDEAVDLLKVKLGAKVVETTGRTGRPSENFPEGQKGETRDKIGVTGRSLCVKCAGSLTKAAADKAKFRRAIVKRTPSAKYPSGVVITLSCGHEQEGGVVPMTDTAAGRERAT